MLRIIVITLLLALTAAPACASMKKYTVPDALGSNCEHVDMTKAAMRLETPCVLKVLRLAYDYLAFLPVLRNKGLIPEEMRRDHIVKAREIFEHYNRFLRAFNMEEAAVDLKNVLPTIAEV